MKRPVFRVILLLVLISHAATATASDPIQAAKELVRQGSAEYSKQHWEAARASFQKAWELKRHYAIAANLADVELKLGRYREAAEHLEYTLANLPPEHADRRADAEASLKECRAHLSTVQVSVSVAGAAVRLDGRELAPDVLTDEILLDPGPHKLEAEKSGYLISSREFAATAGEAREIRLELVPQPPASNIGPVATSRVAPVVPTAHTSASSPVDQSSPRTWVLVAGSAATVVAAGLGVFFLLRESSLKDNSNKLQTKVSAEGSPVLVARQSECAPGAPMRPAACNRLAQTINKQASAGVAANASWIAAGVLGAATAATYLIWPTGREDSPRKGGRLTVAPWLIGARGGALLLDF